MNSYKKLFNNSMVFAIGSLGSKLLNIILVPLYTYYLSTSEYGLVDLGITTIAMLLPIVSGSMQDAVMRFSMDKTLRRDRTVTNSFLIIILGYLIFVLLYPVINALDILPGILKYLYIVLLLQIFDRFLAQYARGIGLTKAFAMAGFIATLFLGIFNILFIVQFNLGVDGYFLAMMASFAISIIYLLSQTKIYKKIRFSLVDLSFMRQLLSYSLPLIPNSLMWWTVNASSRFFILHFNGYEANGVYAVASKIPTVINLISTVFAQAWQLSAIEEVESKKTTTFFSNIFNILVTTMFLAASLIILFIKPVLSIIVSDDFYIAWQASPFLVMGVVFSSFSSFLGAFYIATLKTNGVFRTSLIGGGLSIILNLILIPILGIIGAGISSMVSFFAMSVFRFFDVKRDVNLQLDYKNFFISLMIIFVQTIILFTDLTISLEIFLSSLGFILLLVVNIEIIIFGMKNIKNILK